MAKMNFKWFKKRSKKGKTKSKKATPKVNTKSKKKTIRKKPVKKALKKKPAKKKLIKKKPVKKKIAKKKQKIVKISKKVQKKSERQVAMESIEAIRKKVQSEIRARKPFVFKKKKEKLIKLKKIKHMIVKKEFIVSGIDGLDELFAKGIPKGSSVLIAGGAGSGKTLMCLQILNYHALRGKKCLYMSFEESEKKLIQHMRDFNWHPHELIKSGTLLIKRFNPFDITRSVDALLMEAKGELMIEIEPLIFPKDFKPDFIVVDSLTAIASAFTGKEDSYRIYIEQLFRFFEKMNATSLLITETEQVPKKFSTTGVEEFLADGVIILYSVKKDAFRENGIEVLKLRGAKHKKKIVAMEIGDKGIKVYPKQEIFGGIP